MIKQIYKLTGKILNEKHCVYFAPGDFYISPEAIEEYNHFTHEEFKWILRKKLSKKDIEYILFLKKEFYSTRFITERENFKQEYMLKKLEPV